MTEEITGRILNDIRHDIERWAQETRENTTAIVGIGSELDGLRLEIRALPARLNAEMRDRFNQFERRVETMLDRRFDRLEKRLWPAGGD